MEYEINEEEALYDDSTNPSLEHRPHAEKKPPVSPPNAAPDKAKAQKGVHIPEEEPAAQMA